MLTQSKDLIRKRIVINARQHNLINVGQSALVNFSSNDYLAIAEHPQVKKAFIEGVNLYGYGSGSSALVSGFYQPHRVLEDKFAEFLQRERAILFNSGYLANIGVITALANRSGNILLDKLCHASILDGVQLSRAGSKRYQHNDMAHLDTLLKIAPHPDLLITESVFSMEGNITPLDQIVKISQPSNLNIIVDDAHGIGVLGRTGRGICEHFQLNQQQIACLVVPLGKAFGSIGAIVAGSKELIECLLQFAKTYRYTTALPPAMAHATSAALKIIASEHWRRERLQEIIQFFIKQAKQRGLPLLSEDLTPIKPVLIGDNNRAMQLKNTLEQKGFFIYCIRPPTVAEGTARIRISLNCNHQENEIIELLDIMAASNEEFH